MTEKHVVNGHVTHPNVHPGLEEVGTWSVDTGLRLLHRRLYGTDTIVNVSDTLMIGTVEVCWVDSINTLRGSIHCARMCSRNSVPSHIPTATLTLTLTLTLNLTLTLTLNLTPTLTLNLIYSFQYS